jgi:DNA-binding NtrC family response regulator
MRRAADEDAPVVLVVEDEPDVAEMLKRVIEAAGGFRVQVLTDALDLKDALRSTRPDLVFTDLKMPGMDGMEVIRRVKSFEHDLPVVVVSAFASLENAVRAVKAGAFDFLAKPFRPESVELILAKTERDRRLRRQAREAARHDPALAALIGESAPMARLREWILTVRPTRTTVLLEGESGTGKELVARAIHAGRGPFVAINMAAIPETLAEAELFGYRRGAFTGAIRDRAGLFAEAQGGTLFLDEVNAMSPLTQARLLRVIEERRVRPLGSNRDIEVDFRLVCATNAPLEELVRSGSFRRDLLHRIKILYARLPPLRERRDDIPLLSEHFLHRYSRAHGRDLWRLAPEALAALCAAQWPGNVRELENVIEQAVVLCPPGRTELPLDALPHELGGKGWCESASQDSAPLTLAAAELRHIREVLRIARGNKAEAARLLAIDYKTLLRKLASSE